MRHFFSRISKTITTILLLSLCQTSYSDNALSLPDFTSHQNERSLSNPSYILGQFWFRKISGSSGLMEYPPAYNYLRQAVSRIMPSTGINNKTVELALLNSSQTNAFVIPGNHLFIYSDIMRLIQNESTLMGLLGHEIAHLELHHYERSVINQKNEYSKAFLTLLAGMVAASAGDGDATMALWLGGLANQQENLLSYSRAHEQEADRRGRELLTRSALPTSGMNELLAALARQSRGSNRAEYLSTHPLPQSRLSDSLTAQQNTSVVFEPSSDAFRYFRATMLAYRAAIEGNQAKQLLQQYLTEPNQFHYAYALALVLNHYPEQAQQQLDFVEHTNEFIDYLRVITALTNKQVKNASDIIKKRLALNPSDLTFVYLEGQVDNREHYLSIKGDMLDYEHRMIFRHNIAVARQRKDTPYALYNHARLEFYRGKDESALHLIKRAERQAKPEQQVEIRKTEQRFEQLIEAQKLQSLE